MIGDPLPTPDVVEPIRAYRMWQVKQHAHGLSLVSNNGEAWVPLMPLEARCVRDPAFGATLRWGGNISYASGSGRLSHVEHESPGHSAPHRHKSGPGCGIYAFKDITDGIDQFSVEQVWGEVELWGRVDEHTKGYRAQYARVVTLFAHEGVPVEWLAERYGAEVKPFPLNPDDLAAIEVRKEEEMRQAAERQRQLFDAQMQSMQMRWAGSPTLSTSHLAPSTDVAAEAEQMLRLNRVIACILVLSVVFAGFSTIVGVQRALDGQWGWAALHALAVAVHVVNGVRSWKYRRG